MVDIGHWWLIEMAAPLRPEDDNQQESTEVLAGLVTTGNYAPSFDLVQGLDDIITSQPIVSFDAGQVVG